jgi:Zn-dependent protease with chaperone function
VLPGSTGLRCGSVRGRRGSVGTRFRFQIHFDDVRNQAEQLTPFTAVNPLLTLAVLLLLPIILTLCFGWIAVHCQDAEQESNWAAYRRFGRLILTGTVVGWWVTWDLHGRSALSSAVVSRWPTASSAEPLLFWVLPIVSLGIFLFLANTVDHSIFKLKWTVTDAWRRAWWKVVSFVIPLLLVASGFDALFDKKVGGIAWLFAAGVTSRVGTGFLRRAEGMRFNEVKSGELRNRALGVARRMGVTLGRVYLVPAGKGRLTNAYGMSDAIALTDNLGKYLTKMQVEFLIAHELAHVKLKHGRKHLFWVIAIFSGAAVLLYVLPQRVTPFRPVVQVLAMLGPLVAFYYCSRRFEFSADGEAVAFTGDPETAVRALVGLHQTRELPGALDGLTDLFMTHPSLGQRVQALAREGHLPAERLRDIKFR